MRGRRQWTLSIETLILAMRISPRWTNNCLQRALHFGRTRPNRERGRIDRATDNARFKSWLRDNGV
jgi:hypothetical protein